MPGRHLGASLLAAQDGPGGGRTLEHPASSTTGPGWDCWRPAVRRGHPAPGGLLQADRPAVYRVKLDALLEEIELRAAGELVKRQQNALGYGQHDPAKFA